MRKTSRRPMRCRRGCFIAGGAASEWIVLTLQGYDYPSLGCAALADDGRCSVHA